jgi:hypothetical protein
MKGRASAEPNPAQAESLRHQYFSRLKADG